MDIYVAYVSQDRSGLAKLQLRQFADLFAAAEFIVANRDEPGFEIRQVIRGYAVTVPGRIADRSA